jgi:hypothetical protein
MNTEYINKNLKPVTKKHGTGKLTEPKFKAEGIEIPCCLDTRRTQRVDMNMKVSEFKAIRAENSS